MIAILLSALADAVFGLLVNDLSQRPRLTNLRAKLKGVSPEKLAFQRALTSTYIAFSQKYPDLVAAFFDEQFLQKPEVVSELAKLITPNRIPDKTLLGLTWQKQFANSETIDLSEPLSFFLSHLREQIKVEPLLKPFIDSRAFEQLYLIAERNQEQVEIQSQIRDLLFDIRNLIDGIGSQPMMVNDRVDLSFVNRTDFEERLIDFLIKVLTFQNQANRDALLLGLETISPSIQRSDVPVADLTFIVRSVGAVGQFITGEWPLILLMRNAQRYCSPATAIGQQLQKLLSEYSAMVAIER